MTRVTIWLIIMAAITVFFFAAALTRGRAHEATNVDGYPLGWRYPNSCCRSAQETGGDCAPISSDYVQERSDGYHVNLPVGSHPKLKTKGYSAVIPYGKEKVSPEGNYHICLSTDGAHRYCFFAGTRGF